MRGIEDKQIPYFLEYLPEQWAESGIINYFCQLLIINRRLSIGIFKTFFMILVLKKIAKTC